MINLIVTVLVSLGLTVSVAFAGGHEYTIDSSNYNEYTDMLSAGQLTMFAAYPDTFRMDVHETGADCEVNPDVKAISQTNGTMINDNEGLELLMLDKFLSQILQRLSILFGIQE